ncbi:DegT/DnrJ/EryC1/StrS family aminotransferase [Proteobacteria bacterium 005FR1]|nr:DegT/DnrJ/EryC1/StrS family aminotransferase [Proteobacteria bacterium 005FR1]
MQQRPSPIQIPMVDLKPLHEQMRDPIGVAIAQVLARGDFVCGEAVHRFEVNAAHYLGVKHAIGVNSGTDALMLSLRAAGVGPGDEVITSPFTFWATAEAIHQTGARAVYVDIRTDDMNLDPAALEAAVTERTRAILPVHIFGQCPDMDAIMRVADRHDLVVVEDAAQAFGARSGERCAGSFGLAGCFSFYPSKPLGCFGDGGLITTNDADFAARLRRLINHGTLSQNRHSEFAYNSRLDTIQAAVLDVKLQHLDDHLEERRRLAANYDRILRELEPLGLALPRSLPGRQHCYAQYTIRCENRDQLRDHLAQAGIASAIHYPMPMYRQPAQNASYGDLHLPNAETCSARCLSLPLYQGLTDSQQMAVAESIAAFLGK